MMNPMPWRTLLDMLLGGVILLVLMVIREGMEIYRLGKPVSRETLQMLKASMRNENECKSGSFK